jgi:hypothetical protein
MNKNIWLIPAAIVGFILYKKFVLSQTFSVFFKSIDFSTLSFLNPTIQIIVQVNNPTDVTAEVQNIRGNLFLNGANVGYVMGITPSVLNTGSSLLKIPITLSYAGLSDVITKFSTGGIKLDFDGVIQVDYITLPLQFSYSI